MKRLEGALLHQRVRHRLDREVDCTVTALEILRPDLHPHCLLAVLCFRCQLASSRRVQGLFLVLGLPLKGQGAVGHTADLELAGCGVEQGLAGPFVALHAAHLHSCVTRVSVQCAAHALSRFGAGFKFRMHAAWNRARTCKL